MLEPDNSKDRDITVEIGKVIRKRRIELGYSMEAIAKISGISRGMLGLIESGKSTTTITTLWKISLALKTEIGKLIPSSQNHLTIQIKNSDRKKIEFENNKQSVVFSATQNQNIECFEVFITPGNYDKPKWISNTKDYNVTLLSGEVSLRIDFIWYELKKGDCIAFKGDLLDKIKVSQFKSIHFYITSIREET